MPYTRPQVILGAADSVQSSSYHWVGDARLLTLSVQTSTGSASNITVKLSDQDGFQSSITWTDFSVATVLTAAGIYTLDPGARWMYVERANIAVSASSNATITLNRHLQG